MTIKQAKADQRMTGGTKSGTNDKSALGQWGEQFAADFLAGHGLRVIERNFRVRGGEIDLICRDGAMTVFVEVRLRSRSDFGGAAASITPAKQRRLIVAARHWLQRHGEVPCRFDCVLLSGTTSLAFSGTAGGDIDWIRDAFSAD